MILALRDDPYMIVLIVTLPSKVPKVRTERGVDHGKCCNCQSWSSLFEQRRFSSFWTSAASTLAVKSINRILSADILSMLA